MNSGCRISLLCTVSRYMRSQSIEKSLARSPRAAVVGKIWPAELIASVNSDFFVPGLAGWERGSRGTLILCPSGRISDNTRIAEPATGWAVGFVVCWGMAMPVTA